ncbi:MAG TPA: nuclear transport factor 2 family protein [Acidimicrobiales bacterium]|jgi:ketosteroid isomerase-like protein
MTVIGDAASPAGTVPAIDAQTDVLAANRAFYDAFESRDMDAMSEAWEHSDRIACTHPGWQTLRGWGAVSGSWFALFNDSIPLQFILTNEAVAVEGDVGWVTVDENLIGETISGTVAALNMFVFDGERWRVVVHHGAALAQQ